jgi:hypothetical protein
MPALGKLQLSNDDGTTLGFVALTAIDGVAFTVEDGRIRDFRQIGLFPLHGQLEGMLEAELAALPIDGDVDETTAPELVHLIRRCQLTGAIGVHPHATPCHWSDR